MSRDKQTEIDELQKCIAENTAVYDSDVAQDVAETLIYAGYRKSEEVAREIFAEIDRMCIDTFGNFNHRVFAELKKKYTEDGE